MRTVGHPLTSQQLSLFTSSFEVTNFALDDHFCYINHFLSNPPSSETRNIYTVLRNLPPRQMDASMPIHWHGDDNFLLRWILDSIHLSCGTKARRDLGKAWAFPRDGSCAILLSAV
jgi:hypothetical protein